MKTEKQIPVTILTGFLGSGKTTLLNHILNSQEHKMRFAIIENEFGEVGVDDKLVKGAREMTDDEVIEVMNGCICCTVRGDLVEALKRLYTKIEKFDAVLIETTGLADPAPVAQTFFVDEDFQRMYTLDGIVTVVDGKHVIQHLDEEKAEGVENEAVEQIAFADRILLNKIDLLTEAEIAEVQKRIKAINDQATIFKTEKSQVDPNQLINLGAFDLKRVLEMDPEFLNTDGEHEHDSTVSSCSCKFEGELNVNRLQSWISELIQTKSNDLFRYKGVLAVKNKTDKFVFQGVHMLMACGFSDTQQWQADEARECRFVFIGKNLDKKMLVEKFMECKAEENLRFKIGDDVKCKTGRDKWSEGKVVRVWDDGNPYRVELQNPQKTNIWAPEDRDVYIQGA